MKTTTRLLTLLACTFSLVAMAVANSGRDEGNTVSVLERTMVQPGVANQDPVAPPIPLEPAVQTPVPGSISAQESSVMMDPVIAYQPMVAAPSGNDCCQTCCRRKCRCKPVTTPVVFCLVDPCGCSHEACVDVPACCLGEQPGVTWRQGVVGRQIATLCWECCDHEARVIVTHCGKVRVRD